VASAPATTSAGPAPQRVLHVTAEHDCRRLHCSLRDLSSLLQALGRLADHFIGDEKFAASFDDAFVLVERYVVTDHNSRYHNHNGYNKQLI